MFSLSVRKLKLTLPICSMLLLIPAAAYSSDIRHMNINNEKNQLILDVLKLALSKTEQSYNYIESSNPNVNLVRNKNKIKGAELSVMWAGTSYLLEEELLAIKIPVLKGLLGHRILIIRRNEQQKFSKIMNLRDLTKLRAGQGTFWEDTQILRSNNIPIVTTNKYQNLFPMLAGGRFDFFPRAIHEPWVELKNYPQLDLVVEENILLVYPFAMYFFVSPDNKELAKQIEVGFDRAIDDGSFDRLFFSNSMIKDALLKAKLSNRRTFHLNNPNISINQASQTKKYWLDLEKLALDKDDR